MNPETTPQARGRIWRLIRTTAAAWRDFVDPSAEKQRHAYLAGAVDRVDLEDRLRRLERRPAPFWSSN